MAGPSRPAPQRARRRAAGRRGRRADIGLIDAIYSSDLNGPDHTAEIVAQQLGTDVVVEPRLRERQAGEWEGRTRAEIDEGWPGYLESGRRPDGYEPDESVLERVLAASSAIAEAHDGDVLVITHGGVVRVIERHLDRDADGLIPNLGGRWLLHEGTAPVLGDRVVLLDPDQVTTPEQI